MLMKAVVGVGVAQVMVDKEPSLPSPKTIGGLALGAGTTTSWLSRRPATRM